MLLRELLESEQTDHESRELANNAFDALQGFLEARKGYHYKLTTTDALGGGFVITGKRLGLADDFLIVLAPKQPGRKGAFGVSGSDKVIILFVLKDSYETDDLLWRVGSARDTFVHEYMHYLANINGRTAPTTSAEQHDKNGHDAYYNHPDELNAYYQEAVSSTMRIFQNIVELGHADKLTQWSEMPSAALVKWVAGNLDKGFRESISPSNYRKIEKRLARFVEERLKPY